MTASSTRGAPPRRVNLDDFRSACQAYASRRHDDGKSYAAGWTWREHPMIPSLGHMTRSLKLPLPEPVDDARAEPSDDDSILASMVPPVEHDGDDATPTARTSQHPSTLSLHVDQMVFYSSTWKVPALYLRAYAHSGEDDIAPLSLQELLKSPLFLDTRTPLTALLESEGGNEANSEPHNDDGGAPYFPPISMCSSPLGDEEALGESWQLQLVPWLYLHPCQTAQLVGEMLAAAEDDGDDSEGKCKRQQHERQDEGTRYLEAFLAVCASAVEMRQGDSESQSIW